MARTDLGNFGFRARPGFFACACAPGISRCGSGLPAGCTGAADRKFGLPNRSRAGGRQARLARSSARPDGRCRTRLRRRRGRLKVEQRSRLRHLEVAASSREPAYCRYPGRDRTHRGYQHGDRSGSARLSLLGSSFHRALWCWRCHRCDPSVRLASIE